MRLRVFIDVVDSIIDFCKLYPLFPVRLIISGECALEQVGFLKFLSVTYVSEEGQGVCLQLQPHPEIELRIIVTLLTINL